MNDVADWQDNDNDDDDCGYNDVQNNISVLKEPEVLTRLKRNPAIMLRLWY
jgi:hypothetical protein